MKIILIILIATAFGLTLASRTAAVTTTVPCSDLRGCPDLIVDPKKLHEGGISVETFLDTDCAVVEGATVAGTRRLLRFTSTTPNKGPGNLIIGAPADHPEWFVWAPCHQHYHFVDYADYRLWTPDGYRTWTALRRVNPESLPAALLAANPELARQMVAGGKAGFCAIDLIRYSKYHGSNFKTFWSCQGGGANPGQGISVGWADEYWYGLPGQWIDITDVPPGSYILEDEVNAERLFDEADYANNSATMSIKIQ